MFAFFLVVVIGIAAGLFFDLYRVLAQLFRFKKWAFMVGDILFWLILTPLVFLVLLWGNLGEVRLYVIMGLVLGAAVYMKYMSKFLCPWLGGLLNFLSRAVQMGLRCFAVLAAFAAMPFKIVFILVAKPLGLIRRVFRKAGGFAARKSKPWLAKVKRLIKPKRPTE